jgi:hypothetical protein
VVDGLALMQKFFWKAMIESFSRLQIEQLWSFQKQRRRCNQQDWLDSLIKSSSLWMDSWFVLSSFAHLTCWCVQISWIAWTKCLVFTIGILNLKRERNLSRIFDLSKGWLCVCFIIASILFIVFVVVVLWKLVFRYCQKKCNWNKVETSFNLFL